LLHQGDGVQRVVDHTGGLLVDDVLGLRHDAPVSSQSSSPS
jgi:hypothetical protein